MQVSPGTLSCHLCCVPLVQVVDAAGGTCCGNTLSLQPAGTSSWGFSAPPSSWVLGLSPRTGELWGQREEKEINHPHLHVVFRSRIFFIPQMFLL